MIGWSQQYRVLWNSTLVQHMEDSLLNKNCLLMSNSRVLTSKCLINMKVILMSHGVSFQFDYLLEYYVLKDIKQLLDGLMTLPFH